MEYSDIVYGKFTIPEDIYKIITTPIFQRLKHIKQLGLLYKLIPNAIHTRYEHCIGTYNRAKEMLDRIEQNTAWLKAIPSKYRRAVEIAALLHDIGHGPFSHCWEHIVEDFHHEQNALPCVDSVFKEVEGFEDLRDENNFGIGLIKALILGDTTLMMQQPIEAEFNFLFEIVNNKKCKVDVDKWDYLKRDYHHLSSYLEEANCVINMDFDDLFLEARASDNGRHIQYRYRDYEKIHALFESRFQLHLNCYRLPRNIVCEQVMREIIWNRLHGLIDGVKITKIQADRIPEFLQLTDGKILDMMEADEVNKWMLDIINIECISDEREELQGAPEYMKVYDSISAAGSEMPSDRELQFYGNERDMKIVNCNRGLLIRTSNFRFRSIKAFHSNKMNNKNQE